MRTLRVRMMYCDTVQLFSVAVNNGSGFYGTYAENTTKECLCGRRYGCHAENGSVKRYNRARKYRSARKYDILSVRFNIIGNLCSAKPCGKCVKAMSGYVNRVYYSTSDGDIECITIKALSEQPQHVSKWFRK